MIGGSINRSGAITFRATKVGDETALAQIVALVQQAQSSKAPGQRLADKAAQYLVILAVGSGIITFIAWTVFGDLGFVLALTFAISAVVIACPDALGLATPTAVAVGTGIAARHNILIKDAATLEGLSGIQAVVLDKTGTLTEGKPSLTDVVTSPGWNEDELLRIAAGAEVGSEHPLSKRSSPAPRSRPSPPVEQFQAIAGHGVEARVEGRRGDRQCETDAGSRRRARRFRETHRGPCLGRPDTDVRRDRRSGGRHPRRRRHDQTERTRGDRRFRETGIEVVMMTGDNRRTGEAVARELGIDRVFAEVSPEQKAGYVASLQEEGKREAMVNGVNDAPALAQADVGIAIGAGTDVAIETAKVVLMRSDPVDVMRAWRLSKATVQKMKQNLAWASVYNILAIPIAAGILIRGWGHAAAGVVGAADERFLDYRCRQRSPAQGRGARLGVAAKATRDERSGTTNATDTASLPSAPGLLVVLTFLGHDVIMAIPHPALAADRPSLALGLTP